MIWRIVAVTLAFISLGGEARAWGDLGHQVICEIAYRLVQPNTRAAIDRLMQIDSKFKTFSDSCIYPDHPRIRRDEHFLDLPRDSKGLTSDECPLARLGSCGRPRSCSLVRPEQWHRSDQPSRQCEGWSPCLPRSCRAHRSRPSLLAIIVARRSVALSMTSAATMRAESARPSTRFGLSDCACGYVEPRGNRYLLSPPLSGDRPARGL
jgi:hypothetical protein